MRFLRLDFRSFGVLRDHVFELNPGVSVVYGPNETGKSTFLCALETVLFGFEPSTRAAHPIAVFAEGTALHSDLHVEAELELDSGTVRVERVLLQRGQLRVVPAGEAFTGARESNRPLYEVQGVTRELFRCVYALSSADLVELADDVREDVDQLLLGEHSVPGMRPTYRVRAELAEEASQLWRHDNRGKPRSATLNAAIREARKAVNVARREEAALHEAVKEKRALELELVALRERQRRLEREESDAAFLAELADLAARRAEARPVDLALLDGAQLVAPKELGREIRAIEHKLAEPRARLARDPFAETPAEHAVLARASVIDGHVRSRGRYEADGEALAGARERARTLERDAAARWTRLAGRPPGPEDLAQLARFPLAGLRAAQESWAKDWEAHTARPTAANHTAVPAWVLLVGVAGAILAALGSFAVVHAALGALGVLALLAALVVALRRPGAAAEAPSPPERSADVDRCLAGLELEPALRATPSSVLRLIDQLEALGDELGELSEARERAEELAQSLAAREEEWLALANELAIDDAGAGEIALARLEDALARARERRDEVLADAADRTRAQTLVDAYLPELERHRAHLHDLHALLREHAPDAQDPAAAFALVERHLEAERYLATRAAELRADPRWTLLSGDPRLARPEADDAPWLPARARERKEELRAIELEVERQHHRFGELAERLRSDEGSRVARAQERQLALEVELDELRVTRDRVALLERLLAEADRVHRDENQPDVLRRASGYLESITAGRYTHLDYAIGAADGLHVTVQGRTDPIPVAPPLSRGTRDQIYLCLRLGLLDHLDEGRPALPLVLDETLVHWDAERRAELYPLLARVAERRQIFILTCHENLAREVESALAAGIIDLGAIVPKQQSLQFE